MTGDSTSSHSESQDKACKRKWTPVEDSALISCMVDLYNLGTYKADTGFRSGYFLELERMLAELLEDVSLKAKPHIESRIRTLKKDWSILYDLSKSDSGFGWDSERNMSIAKDEVSREYTKVHKEATGFRYRNFPYYHELSMIYGKDRATGKDGQMLEELLVDISAQKNQSELGDGVDDSTNVNMMDTNIENLEDMSHNESVGKRNDETTSRRKKRKTESSSVDAFTNAVKLIGNDIKEACEKLSKSIEADSFLSQCQKLYSILSEIDGLTPDERRLALKEMPKQAYQIVILFSLPPEQLLVYVNDILS